MFEDVISKLELRVEELDSEISGLEKSNSHRKEEYDLCAERIVLLKKTLSEYQEAIQKLY